jgi:AcrR family transcriptional regulator
MEGEAMANRTTERVGRPRSFDTEKTLDKAVEVFRAKGYEGASLTDLTEAMGINRPSMYAAFGDKESLFRKVLDRYSCQNSQYLQQALEQQHVADVARHLLYGAADALTGTGHAPGCLITQGALVCGEQGEPIRRELVALRGKQESLIRDRLKKAKRNGDLPEGANPADLARYLVTVVHGMSVLASSGANRAELRRVAETALRAWPH